MADRGIRIIVDTQELSFEDEATIMKLRGSLGWFVFSDQSIDATDIPNINIDPEIGETKTPSQRLRNTIYRLWETTNKSLDWDSFYKKRMDQHINIEKDKLC